MLILFSVSTYFPTQSNFGDRGRKEKIKGAIMKKKSTLHHWPEPPADKCHWKSSSRQVELHRLIQLGALVFPTT